MFGSLDISDVFASNISIFGMYWQIENIVFGKACFSFSAAAVALTGGRRAITDPIRSVGNFPMHFQNHFSNQF